ASLAQLILVSFLVDIIKRAGSCMPTARASKWRKPCKDNDSVACVRQPGGARGAFRGKPAAVGKKMRASGLAGNPHLLLLGRPPRSRTEHQRILVCAAFAAP